MVQVVPQSSRSAMAGQQAASGVANALNYLADQKASQMKRRQQSKALTALGIPAEATSLDPSILKELLSQKGKKDLFERALSIGQEGEPHPQRGTAAGQPRRQQAPSPGTSESILGAVRQVPGMEEVDVDISAYVPNKTPSPQSELSTRQLAGVSAADSQTANLLQREKARAEKASAADKALAYKDTKEFRKETATMAKSAGESLQLLDEMRALEETGNVIGPVKNWFRKTFRVPWSVFNSPESEQYEKLQKQFLKTIKSWFPGKVNVVEVQNFLKGVPGLDNTQAGRSMMRDSLTLAYGGSQLRNDVMKAVIKGNGGEVPLNLEAIVDDIVTPKLREMGDQFTQKMNESKELLESQGPLLEEMAEFGDLRDGYVWIRTPDGTLGQMPQENAARAEEMGIEVL